jgi:hypothetical protein
MTPTKRTAKGGRPRKELSDEDYDKLVAMIRIQCTRDEICDVLGMAESTLDRRIKERKEGCFEALFKKHQGEGRASLRRAQWKNATEHNNATMQVWLGKQMLGQRDQPEQEGESEAPTLNINITSNAPVNGPTWLEPLRS